MRTSDAPPPRWGSILVLLLLAVAIAWATQRAEREARARVSRDLPPAGRAAGAPTISGSAAASPAPAGTEARPETSEATFPRPIASPPGPESPLLSPDEPGPGALVLGPPSPPRAAGGSDRLADRLAQEMGRPVAVVSAQVIDQEGRPVPGVEAILGDRAAVSDAHGELVLPQKPADLVLRHPEYFPRTFDPEMRRGSALPSSDEACERVILVLFPGGRVRGRVSDAGARPVPGVEVSLDGDEAPAATTDARGCFLSPILRPGIH